MPPSLPPRDSLSLSPWSLGTHEDRTLEPSRVEEETMLSCQAQLPNLHYIPPAERDFDGKDQILWDPDVLPEQEVEEYLIRVSELQHRAGRTYVHDAELVRDNEQALYELVKCGFNSEEAIRRLHFNVKVVQGGLGAWSEDERRHFEHGFRVHGKNFHLIQANKVRTRSVGECVQYYYLWKKSERYELFRQSRLGKRKFGNAPSVENEFDLPEAACPTKLHESVFRGERLGQTAVTQRNSVNYTTCSCNKDQCSCGMRRQSVANSSGYQKAPPITGDLISLNFSQQTLPLLPDLKAQDPPLSTFSMTEMALSDFLSTPSLLCTASLPP
ncbi:mesoderm induction early response protein 2 isoform X1 [Xenopus laevis]|uniref:Mesoderm induction Early response protein 2 isoform X1 n=2 Tax=Xenopus laevis TaxID=8355 RepID=A0A8J1KLM8_XENLA|nr:mesoderm induction early response protein 2 isoform X1 [Xenopus laevis]XP_018111472.1 mesoderm induction early response protein 2 isoform X1 [Xenopus laevis]XP_041418221.1 mesoderm induction early response protein 2 isoform X1 [Xenopus laevis]XP_041418232.1 mesoderm induction early response protein 2 isoform X1 [Xenopus laevis]XP_041418239.1 mesoderm induction early response protein 2 isoform X1 [Xenopus laevis]